MTTNRSSSSAITTRFPSRRRPVTRFPSTDVSGGSTERRTNGLRMLTCWSGCPRIRGLSAARYRVISGSSGMRRCGAGAPACRSALDHVEAAGRPNLGLGTPRYHVRPARWVETGSSHQYTVELRLGQERGHVTGVDAAAVQNGHGKTHATPAQLHTNELMDLGCIIRCCVLPRTDGPHRFIGEHHLAPGLDLESLQHRTDLAHDDLLGAPSVSFRECLTDAHQRGNAGGERRPGLPGHLLVGLAEKVPAFRMAHERKARARLYDHRDRDGSGISAPGLPMNILRANGDVRPIFQGGGERRNRDGRREKPELETIG